MTAEAALVRFARNVRAAYGDRVRLVLFGSRARGDGGADSDVDVAVVLDAVGDRWAERERLWDIAYESTVEHGVHVQPWPVTEGSGRTPACTPTRRSSRPCDATGWRCRERSIRE